MSATVKVFAAILIVLSAIVSVIGFIVLFQPHSSEDTMIFAVGFGSLLTSFALWLLADIAESVQYLRKIGGKT